MDALESRCLLAAGDFEFYRRGTVPAAADPFANPQIASLGETFFASGNDYARVSDDDGITWSTVNRGAVFPPIPASGTQANTWDDAGIGTTRLATDPTRGMVTWLAAYAPRIPLNQDGEPILEEAENGFRLAVSYSDEGLQDSEWVVHDFSMYQLGQVKGVLLVNPQMQVSDNFVHIEADVIALEEEDGIILEKYQRSLWWRVSLDELRGGGNITRGLMYQTDASSLKDSPIGLINGGGDIMYGAANIPAVSGVSGARFRIYRWKDSDANPVWVEKAIPSNPTVSDFDPVARRGVTSYLGTRTDANDDEVDIIFPNKVQTGWLTPSGELGFMWNSAPRPGSPIAGVPARSNSFIRSVVVDSTKFFLKDTFGEPERLNQPNDSFPILSQPDLYSNGESYFYPAAAVNAEGGVAAVVGRYSGNSPNGGSVANDILILDQFTPAGLPSNGAWERYQAASGTTPVGSTPDNDIAAGRYYGILADDNYPNTWLAAGNVDVGGSSPRFYWFGREKDHPPPNLMGAELDVTQDAAHAGDAVTMRYRVANEGITDAGPFDVAFYASVDEEIDPATDTFIGTDLFPAGLGAGITSALRTANFVMPDASDPFWAQVGTGGYYIGMFTDSGEAVAESNETDNRNLGIAIDVTQMFPESFGSNNTKDTASDLGFLSGLRSYDRLAINPAGDQDWYRVVAPFNGTLTATIDFQNISGNLSLFIRDPSNVILGSSTTSGNGETVTISVAAGSTYYIHVEGATAADQNTYVMTTDYRITPADAFEPNNILQTAFNFGTDPIVSVPDLNIHQFDNEDYYRFTAPGSGPFTGKITFQNQYGNLDFYLYDRFGALVDQSTTDSNTETVTGDLNGGDQYYLRVNGRGTDTNQYSLEYDAAAPPVFVSGNTIFVTGNSPDDVFTFIPNSPGPGSNRVVVNSVSFTVPASSTKFRFDGRGGNNTVIVNGTAGIDTITSTFTTVKMNGFTMDLFAIQNLTLQGQAGGDKITATGGRIVTINGGDGNDAIFGGTSGDLLVGGAGQDRIFGGGGDDTLMGEEASDILNGGEGTDRLIGGGGNDTYQFGEPFAVQIDYVDELTKEGADTLDFANSTNTTVTVDLTKDNALALHGLRTVRTFAANQARFVENAVGTRGNDVLLGNDANNDLTGGDGDDHLEGRTGDDRYMFGDTQFGQSDRIREFNGNGRDTIHFGASTLPAIVDLLKDTGIAIQGARTVSMFGAGQAKAMENIVGGFGNDTLLGNMGNNVIEGGEGSDSMQGRGGDDRYLFRDALQIQTDTIAEFDDGGRDTLDFSGLVNALTDVNVDLRTTGQTIATHASRTVAVATAGQARNFEVIIGSLGNDILIGNSAENSIFGGSGRDILVGSRGSDFIRGGSGDDILIGGSTSHNLTKLQQIRLEWVSNASYNARVSNIRGPNSGLNGQNFLTIDTVFEDGFGDTLRGDADNDWFWLATGDTDDRGGGEAAN
jgi:Ca2+-binding RTX toxin-like protein